MPTPRRRRAVRGRCRPPTRPWSRLPLYPQAHNHVKTNPLIALIYPPLTVAFAAVALPLAVFSGAPREFADHVNPLIPSHFWFITRKTYRGLLKNNLKLGEKDL